MVRRQYTVLVGLFTLAALAVFAWMAVQFSGGVRRHRDAIRVIGVFNQAGGLIQNAPVYFSGVEIGWVETIEISGTGKVRVHMRVARQAHLRETDVPEIYQRGMLGDMAVNFIRGEKLGDLAKDDYLFVGKDPVDIIRKAEEIITQFETVLERLSSEEVTSALRNIVLNIEAITGQAREDLANLREILTPEFREDLRTIVANARRASEDLPDLITQAAQLFRETRANTTDILRDLSKRAPQFDRILTSVDNILTTVARGEGTIGGLVKDPTLYSSAVATLDSLRDAIIGIKYHGPIWGRRIQEEEAAQAAEKARAEQIWRR